MAVPVTMNKRFFPSQGQSIGGERGVLRASGTLQPDFSQLGDTGGALPSNPGGVQLALQRLRGLKNQLTSGQITSASYLQQAQPLVQQASSITGNISKQGSNQANSVNPIWQQIQDENFAKADQGKWVSTLPLSEQEYASLPASAKPTADQINQGLVPTNSLPGNVGLNTMIQQQQQQQQDLGQQAIDQTKSSYDSFANDSLKNLLDNLTNGSLGQQFKGSYNNLGILNSGALSEGVGNTIAQNQSGIRAQEQNSLDNIMNSIYGTNSQLGVGGLQRNFSMTDFYNQADLQKQLADMQNNAYMSAINSQKMNPWTQFGLSAGQGLFQGIGQSLGRGGH